MKLPRLHKVAAAFCVVFLTPSVFLCLQQRNPDLACCRKRKSIIVEQILICVGGFLLQIQDFSASGRFKQLYEIFKKLQKDSKGLILDHIIDIVLCFQNGDI